MRMRVTTLRQRTGATSQQHIGSQATDTVGAAATCTAVSATQRSCKQMTIRVTSESVAQLQSELEFSEFLVITWACPQEVQGTHRDITAHTDRCPSGTSAYSTNIVL
jgi:hypothetical protein